MQSFYLLFYFLDRRQFTISYSLIFHVCKINTFFSLSLSLQKSTGRMCDNEMVLIQYTEKMRGTMSRMGAKVLSVIPIGKLSSLFNTIENGLGKVAGENRLPKR